ncbi:T9SS type A sorting domain-containing protein [Hymenobacter cellulosivorans]|uniref:T9SS type A sorting domain-containing protein n=1 Tax=Hymenobacter cellulosivorans TaxID=2932249 RepID=A0ABY4F577_9BACT|nr:T9SS type A sorting domain-containing protein [Hymenobacter cellulosivorans]UOQ51720.1 T9SS type A sorting domain-containing protein [Hymenobacter cellulosivorans]
MIRTFLPSLLASAVLLGTSLLSTPAAAQAPAKQWDKTFGGSYRDELTVMRPTREGGVILGGYSTSNISGDRTQASPGYGDYWVVKVDAAGNKQWDKAFGSSGNGLLKALQQTPDGGYLLGGEAESIADGDKTQVGNGDYDYWIIKIDANGTKQWDKTFGGQGVDHLTGVELTADGGYILLGSSDSGIGGDKTQANRGSYDFWVVKIDAVGNKVWDKTFGGATRDYAFSLCTTRDGGVLLVGDSSSPISGDKSQAEQGNLDFWVVKLNATGTKEWDRTLGGSLSDQALGVQQAPDGNYLIAGTSYSGISGDKTQASKGNSDIWVVKLDPLGNKVWDRSLGGNRHEDANSILATSDGGMIVAGSSFSGISGDKTQPSRGGYDFWLVKLDGVGTTQWDLSLGGPDHDPASALASQPNGGLVVAGTTYPGIGGDKTQIGYGEEDFWLVKLQDATITGVRPTLTKEPLTIYPNPAHNRLTLHLAAEAPRTGLRLSLLDALGRSVYAQPLGAGGPDVSVEVGQHPAGLYLLRVEGPDGYAATQRVVLE